MNKRAMVREAKAMAVEAVRMLACGLLWLSVVVGVLWVFSDKVF